MVKIAWNGDYIQQIQEFCKSLRVKELMSVMVHGSWISISLEWRIYADVMSTCVILAPDPASSPASRLPNDARAHDLEAISPSSSILAYFYPSALELQQQNRRETNV